MCTKSYVQEYLCNIICNSPKLKSTPAYKYINCEILDCYPEIKMNSILLCSEMNPTNVILSERSQIPKNILYFFKVFKDVRSKGNYTDDLKSVSTNVLILLALGSGV